MILKTFTQMLTLRNGILEMSDIHTCYYCKSKSELVEAGGAYHCNNLICNGPGAGWFRQKCKSYNPDVNDIQHSVDVYEWHQLAYDEINNYHGYVVARNEG